MALPPSRIVINALLQGSDLAAQGPDGIARARTFLSHLIDAAGDPSVIRVALPIARRYMSNNPVWHHQLKVGEVVAFSRGCVNAFLALDSIAATPSCDPQAIFLIGALTELQHIIAKRQPNA